MTATQQLTQRIKAEALRLGFFACGAAKAEPVEEAEARHYRSWVEHGMHAGMDYMARNVEKRLDPTLLVPGVKTILSLAYNYNPAQRLPVDGYQIATYAYGKDYHEVIKEKLRLLAAASILMAKEHGLPAPEPFTGGTAEGDAVRIFCDTAPVLERYWAAKAGLGWIGRHHQLIIPRAGSRFFLAEVFLPFELEYDTPIPSRCGNCRRCIDACPTQAILWSDAHNPETRKHFISERCISYQTIENRGEIAPEVAEKLHNNIYGCDICLNACPWNRKSPIATEPLFTPSEELLAMTPQDWQQLTQQQYQRLFKGSAVKRAKFSGLQRNIAAVARSVSNTDRAPEKNIENSRENPTE